MKKYLNLLVVAFVTLIVLPVTVNAEEQTIIEEVRITGLSEILKTSGEITETTFDSLKISEGVYTYGQILTNVADGTCYEIGYEPCEDTPITKIDSSANYTYSVHIEPEDGYKLANDVVVYIDGVRAYLIDYSNGYNVLATNAKTIDSVEVTDATVNFKVGDKPVFTAKETSSLYDIETEMWYTNDYDYEDEELEYESVYSVKPKYESEVKELTEFAQRKYAYGLILKAKAGYVFANDVKITINGQEIKAESYGDYLYLSGYKRLDLTDRPIDEKNKEAIQYSLFENAYLTPSSEESVTGITKELYDKIEAAQINGDEIDINLTVNEIKDETAIKNLNAKISSVLTKEYKVASYLDIAVPITINDTVEGYVTEFVNLTTVIINKPADLPAVANGAVRTFKVIRIHEDQVDVLPVIDNGDGTLKFESNLFSDYILTYTDTTTPNTGDNVMYFVVTLIVSALGLASIVAYKKLSK